MFNNQKEVERVKSNYPKGTRIELISMAPGDPHPIDPGRKGTVYLVDGIGTLHVEWDNGRSLGLVLGEDKYKAI